MKTLGRNIKRLRNSRGLTQQQLADVMGASNYTTVSKWESGANSPRGGDLVMLSEFFGVSVDELLGINNGGNIAVKHDYPYIPTAISAGLPINVDGITNDQVEKISLPDSVMGKWAGKQDIFITKINGDSMDKIMPHGSLIAVKPVTINELKDGDMVVFSDNYDYSVKCFYQDGDRLIFKPESYNKKHTDQIYSVNDGIEIHGKVVLYIVERD